MVPHRDTRTDHHCGTSVLINLQLLIADNSFSVRTIQEIFSRYQIPPPLVHHLFRVSAFSLYVSDHMQPDIVLDRKFITSACLFHDIGNIIKFDFRPGKLLEIPEAEVPKWLTVQQQFIQKYGNNENEAVSAIVAEVGLDKNVQALLRQTGIEKVRYALQSDDWSIKLARIGDERISPQGVVSVRERYADILSRYAGRNHHLANKEENVERISLALKLEQQIQQKCSIDLQKIHNSDIEPSIENLKEYKI